MCGLTGYILQETQEISPIATHKMLELQRHRGPDDSGIVGISTVSKGIYEKETADFADFVEPCNVIFGFNRLSILDLSPNGHQPMITTDNRVVLMMNGEIYNAFDYKEELVQKGYTFKSHTDTEVVLHLYTEYGMDGMIQRLNGMFAIAIMDLHTNHLFLARDRFGIKPLYILREKNRLAFSSEMKSFKALSNFAFTLDTSRLDEFLLFRNVVNKTLFENIENVVPGTYVRISLDTWKEEVITYYDVNKEGGSLLPVTESLESLREALKNSVKRQMISDVKLGTQLSGGVDSSLVAFFASKKVKKGDLETISITFDDTAFSEEKYVDEVVKKLHLKAHKFVLREDYYFKNLEKATWHFEQPINHPNTIGIYFLSEEAKARVTVLLSGEGADESLAGYSRFINVQKSPFLTPSWYKNLVRNGCTNMYELIAQFTKEKRTVLSSSFNSISNIRQLKKNFSLRSAIKDRVYTYQKLKGTEICKHRKYELLTFLPDLLMRQDKMSMAHSIENRVPFLDNEMMEVSMNLPDEVLIKRVRQQMEGKNVLKEICADAFSDSFAYRDKMGFGIPLRAFFSSAEFQKKWEHEIAPGIEKRAIFSVVNLKKWMKKLNQLSNQQLDAIWLMVAFETWAKQYLD